MKCWLLSPHKVKGRSSIMVRRSAIMPRMAGRGPAGRGSAGRGPAGQQYHKLVVAVDFSNPPRGRLGTQFIHSPVVGAWKAHGRPCMYRPGGSNDASTTHMYVL
jgi:hypothetical protein